MRLAHQLLSAFLFMVIFPIFLPTNAISENNTCHIQSNFTEFQFVVYDVLPSQAIGNVLWQGALKEGQREPLKSNYGRIFYEYMKDSESTTSMVRGLVRWCKNGETVDLP